MLLSLILKSKLFVSFFPIILLIGIGVTSFSAAAQDTSYPNKPVRIIVPFPPGGSNDIIGRFIASKLSSRMGRQFVIDNRGGADSEIGTSLAATSQPDGYTLLLASVTYAMLPATGKKISYDPIRSLVPVATIGVGPNLFATWPGL